MFYKGRECIGSARITGLGPSLQSLGCGEQHDLLVAGALSLWRYSVLEGYKWHYKVLYMSHGYGKTMSNLKSIVRPQGAWPNKKTRGEYFEATGYFSRIWNKIRWAVRETYFIKSIWWFRETVPSVRGVISPSGGKCCDEEIQTRLTNQFVCSICMATRSRKELSTNADVLPLLSHMWNCA